MVELSTLLVGLWLLPVTMQILVPLVVGFTYSVVKLSYWCVLTNSSKRDYVPEIEEPKE